MIVVLMDIAVGLLCVGTALLYPGAPTWLLWMMAGWWFSIGVHNLVAWYFDR